MVRLPLVWTHRRVLIVLLGMGPTIGVRCLPNEYAHAKDDVLCVATGGRCEELSIEAGDIPKLAVHPN